jgi:hypothetical protein
VTLSRVDDQDSDRSQRSRGSHQVRERPKVDADKRARRTTGKSFKLRRYNPSDIEIVPNALAGIVTASRFATFTV